MSIIQPGFERFVWNGWGRHFDEFDEPVTLGGKGSGNFGHKGRPGEVGGSADDGVSEPKLSPKAQREQEKLKQQELADKQTNPLAHPPVILGRPMLFGIEDYVAAYGEEFTPTPLPEDVERGPMGQCYRNATLLVLSRPDLDLDFAEGFAQSAGTGDLSFMHAWAVTKDGKVLDPTWDKPEGGKYFGVRYDRRAYLKGIEKRKYYGVIGASDKNAQKVIDTGGAKLRSGARNLGGPGSGNFGHAGRPGEVGGSVSVATSEAVQDYSSASEGINSALRDGAKLSPYEQQVVSAFDKALSSSKLPVHTMLYRAVPSQVFEGLVDGQTYSDDAFVSTSTRPDIADALKSMLEDSGIPSDFQTVQVIAPKGSPAIDVNNVLGANHVFNWQQEVVLPRGSQFRVERQGSEVKLHLLPSDTESVFHGTSVRSAELIRKNGLKLSATRSETGIFATPKFDLALAYAATATLNSNSKVALDDRMVAVVEVKASKFVPRTTEIDAVGGMHLEHVSHQDVPASEVLAVKLYRYKDVVKGGRVVAGASPVRVLASSSSLYVGLSFDDLEELSSPRLLGGFGSGNFGHAGRPGQVGGSSSDGDFARFESQVLGALQTQSRTIGQFKDSGSVTDKPSLAVEGKAAGDLADRNARKALRMVFDKQSLTSPADAEDFITQVNKQLTEGMLQPGQSQLRTWETPHKQTPPDQIEQGLKDFSQEFYNRMQDNDPAATAAWVERELDSRLHPFADAVGRTTKIISNWVLDRTGLPSPTYPTRSEYYSQIEKPLASWTDYYRSMLAPKTAEDADMTELTVLGRTGEVTYLDDDLNFTTLEGATWARVEYPDGEILTLRSLGGPGSGNFGHKGRPGEVGGSMASDEVNVKPASTPADLTKGKNETPEIKAILAKPSSAYPKARTGPTMMAVDHANDPDAAHDKPRGLDTLQEHTLADGSITPERRALHEAIVEKMLYGHKPPSDAPVAHLMGGGGASGKSVMQSQLTLPEDQVHINVDIIRTHLPEWDEELTRAKAENRKADNYLGNYTHEEASVISKMVIDRASREGMNLMVDGAGDTSVDKVAQNVARYKVGGQKVIADYVTVDYDLAYQRMRDRGDKTGRYIPAAHLRAVYAEVARVFPAAVSRGLFDEFTLWDTSASTPGVNAKPAKIASGRGSDITIHDQDAWKKFLERGKGIAPRAGEI